MANQSPGNIVQIQEHAAFTQRLSKSRAADLLQECRHKATEHLAKTAARAMDTVDDALFALADKAETNALQGRYFDAMREIRINRQGIEASFMRHFCGEAVRLEEASPGMPEKNQRHIVEAGLSLVENNDLEETLAIDALADKLEALCPGELNALNERMGFLLHNNGLKTIDNPLGPKNLCRAFKAACGSIESGVDIKIIVFKLFDKYICESIQAHYQDINEYLAANGVLPKLTAQINKTSPPQASGGIHQGTNLAGTPQGGDTDFLSAFAQLLTADKTQHMTAKHVGPAAGDASHVIHDLTLLQRGQWEALGMQASTIDPAALSDGMHNVVRIIKGNPLAGELGGNNVVIEVVALLFDYIFENDNVPDKVKALIGRLQIPILKVAILDASFFSKRHHPARLLLNTLAHASVGVHGEHGELYREIETCIQKVQAEFDTDIGTFEMALKNLEEYLENRQTHLDNHIEEAKNIMRGRERLKIAESLADEVIEKKLSGKHFPEFIKSFAMDKWKNLLLVAYLKEGQESDAWKNRLEMLDLLIWSSMPKTTPKDRKKLVEMLPTLISGLETGMRLLALTDPEQHEFMEKLAKCHARAVNGEAHSAEVPLSLTLNTAANSPTSQFSTPKGAPSMEPSIDQRGTMQIEEITLRGPRGGSKRLIDPKAPAERLQVKINPFGDAPPASSEYLQDNPPDPAVAEDEYTEVLRNLIPGIWLTFKQADGGTTMERVTWISAVLGSYLFTNNDGIKTREISSQELEDKLRSGQAMPADDLSFLVDRSLNSLLDDMQKKIAG